MRWKTWFGRSGGVHLKVTLDDILADLDPGWRPDSRPESDPARPR